MGGIMNSNFILGSRSLKMAGALALLTLVTGCKDFKGRIEILKPLQLNVVKGDSQVGVGANDISVTFKSKNEVKLEISKAGKNNNPQVLFKLPERMRLPNYSGPVDIPAESSGQNYDVQGFLESETFDGPVVRDYNTCTVEVPLRQCYLDNKGREICSEKVTGREMVEYFDRETHSRIDLALLEAASSERAAQLVAFDTQTERRYIYRGRCEIGRRGWFR
jgi:hypothetical protein